MTTHSFSARPGYALVTTFRADRPRVEIDLCDNTNQWGVAPSALAALQRIDPADIREYPPMYSPDLVSAVAEYIGVPTDTVVTGCGSDDLLNVAMRALAQPGDRIAHPSPSFAMVPIHARTNGLEPVGIPVRANGDIDAPALLATDARIIYLCTPNNPTGTPHSREAIMQVIDAAPGVVILDEAYAEYADAVYTGEAVKHPHVFAIRTLSKSFGLAGLRVGFGVGDRELVSEIIKARAPYKVNALADRAATAALRHDGAWMSQVAAETRVVRERFMHALSREGLHALPSQANFVCVPVADAAKLVQRLHAHGIALRAMSKLPGIGDALRIGLAPWPIMERVLAALRAELA